MAAEIASPAIITLSRVRRLCLMRSRPRSISRGTLRRYNVKVVARCWRTLQRKGRRFVHKSIC